MKPFLRIAAAILPLLAVTHTPARADPVDYVRVCDEYGPHYFVSPGSESCVQASTGRIKTEFMAGLVTTETSLAERVRALESEFCDECFAVVRRDGTSSLSRRMVSSTRVGVGHYQVEFVKGVRQCALNATLTAGQQTPVPTPGLIAAGLAKDTSGKGVSVYTYTPSGVASDRAFHLSLECVARLPTCTLDDGTNITECDKDDFPSIP